MFNERVFLFVNLLRTVKVGTACVLFLFFDFLAQSSAFWNRQLPQLFDFKTFLVSLITLFKLNSVTL